MDTKKFFQRPIFWVIFVFVFSVVLTRYFKIDIHEPGFGRSWYYGDNSSEGNVESAARFYKEHGYGPNAGLPTYNHLDEDLTNNYVYTHYPPMAEWLGGVSAKITGSHSDQFNSILPLLLSVVLFFMIFKVLGRWFDNSLASFIGASVLVLSNYFISWADDAHQHLYVEFFKWIFVYCWWLYLTEKRPFYYILLLAFCYAMMCLFSFEPYVYIAIVIVGFPIALKQKVVRWEVAALLLVPVLAFGLRLYLNAQYLGGFSEMIADMKGALLNRTGRSAENSELERTMTFSDYIFKLPRTRLQRLGHFYIFPSLIVVLLGILGAVQIRKYNRTLFRLLVVIYIASISWVLVMPQHALIHIFTLRHLSVLIGMVSGFGIVRYYSLIKQHWQERKYAFLTIHTLLLAYTFSYIAVNTVYFVYLKYGYLYPNLGTDKYELLDSVFF